MRWSSTNWTPNSASSSRRCVERLPWVVGLSAAVLQGADTSTVDIDLWFEDREDPRIHEARGWPPPASGWCPPWSAVTSSATDSMWTSSPVPCPTGPTSSSDSTRVRRAMHWHAQPSAPPLIRLPFQTRSPSRPRSPSRSRMRGVAELARGGLSKRRNWAERVPDLVSLHFHIASRPGHQVVESWMFGKARWIDNLRVIDPVEPRYR